jgi:hypothetical protein
MTDYRDRDEILEDIDALDTAISVYRVAVKELGLNLDDDDKFEDELLEERLALEKELTAFDKRFLN